MTRVYDTKHPLLPVGGLILATLEHGKTKYKLIYDI